MYSANNPFSSSEKNLPTSQNKWNKICLRAVMLGKIWQKTVLRKCFFNNPSINIQFINNTADFLNKVSYVS